jgi:hypothetical protein
MNPDNPSLGRYQVISLIDARNSLKSRLGGAVNDALRIATERQGHEGKVNLPALMAAA